MFKSNDQLKVETQKSVDIALHLVTTSIQSVDKLTQIQLESSRQILAETTQSFKNMSQVTDAKEAEVMVNMVVTQTVEKSIASARDVFDVVNEVQTKISQITDVNLQHIQQSALNSVENLAKYNSDGAQVAGDLVKIWIQNSSQALALLNKVSVRISKVANSNLDSVATATLKAVKQVCSK